MKTALTVILMFMASLAGFGQTAKPKADYVITRFRHTNDGVPRYEYVLKHGNATLTVLYNASQTGMTSEDFERYLRSAANDGSGKHLPLGLQEHVYYEQDHGDISQVPEVGVSIHQCALSHDSKGRITIAIQPTPDPCMMQNGDTLSYSPSPNGPLLFSYVNFDIVSERLEAK